MTLERLLRELNDVATTTGRDPRTLDVVFTTDVHTQYGEEFPIARTDAHITLVDGVLEIDLP